MVTSVRFDPLSSWFTDGGGFNSNPLVLAQFFQNPVSPPPVASQPLIPEISINPARPNELLPQAGVVTIQRFPGLENGARTQTNAIVLHMTGGDAANTLTGYRTATNGAHFLIARDGTITQTAGMDQIAHHVGRPRPKGYQAIPGDRNLRVDADLTPASEAILDKMEARKITFVDGIRQLAALEQAKAYGEDRTDESTRGPVNGDSIGIEFEAVPVNGEYPALTDAQRASGKALVELLQTRYGLDYADVYQHPDVSYKNYTEARGAKHQIEYYGGE